MNALNRLRVATPPLLAQLWLMLVLLSACSTAMAATVKVSLSQSEISLAEIVNLQITYDGQTDKNPVTRGLSKDFKVLGTSRSTKVEFINGVVSAQTAWQVRLQPKRVGKLKIPAITVAGKQSAPLSLVVTKVKSTAKKPLAPKADAKPKRNAKPVANAVADVLVKTSVEPANPYVREMVIYTVRIFHATQLVEGELPDPVLENALVRRLDPDKSYSETLGKKRYKVIERRYAIFPQQTGALKIPAPVLSAKVLDRSRRGGLMDDDSIFSKDPFFSQTPFGGMLKATRAIRIAGKAVSLEVKPPAAGVAANESWLPAREVGLSETYEPEEVEVKVGDPVVREIRLRIDGLTGAQIPQLVVGEIPAANIYQDKPKLRTRGNKTGVLGDIIQRFTYVPTEAGSMGIPALKVHWWDVVNDKSAVAELPARTIQILSKAGEVVEPKPPETSPPVEKMVPKAVEPEATPTADVAPVQPVTKASSSIWPWLTLLLGVLWLGTLLLLWHKNYRKPAVDSSVSTAGAVDAGLTAVESRRKFEQACRANDPTQARNYLLQWADAHWPENPPSGLTGLAKRLKESGARKAVHALDLCLFNAQGEQWDGQRLLKALKKLPVKSTKNSSQSGLPGLYQSE